MEGVVPGMRALSRIGALLAGVAAMLVVFVAAGYGTAVRGSGAVGPAHFLTSDRCISCHNSLTTPSGADASIGFDWRASIMANSSRDPYWQASIRREVLEHPSASAEIQDECTTCHMPMQRFAARAGGGRGLAFERFPTKRGTDPLDSLAADGSLLVFVEQTDASTAQEKDVLHLVRVTR